MSHHRPHKNIYINSCKMCLSFLVFEPSHPFVCVFVFVCVACVSQSCSVFSSIWISVGVLFSHLDGLPPLCPEDHQHCSQNFLYFQNRLFRLQRRRAREVGGLREPCVAFYGPSQLHALVAAAGNKEERLDKILGGDVRTRSVEILNEKEGECVSLKSTLIIIWCGRE